MLSVVSARSAEPPPLEPAVEADPEAGDESPLLGTGSVAGCGAGSPDGVASEAGGSLVGGSDGGGSDGGGSDASGGSRGIGFDGAESLADGSDAGWVLDADVAPPTEVAPPVGVAAPAEVDPTAGADPLVVGDRGASVPEAPAPLSRLGEGVSSASAGRTIDSIWLGPSVPVGPDSHWADGSPALGVKASPDPSPMPPAAPARAALPSPVGAAHVVGSSAVCIAPPIAGTAATVTRRAAAMARLVGAGMGIRASRGCERVNAASTQDAAGV